MRPTGENSLGLTNITINNSPKRISRTSISKSLNKFIIFSTRTSLRKTSGSKSSTRLLLSKPNPTRTQSLLSFTLSIRKSSRRSSRTSLSLIKSSLALNIRTVSILHKVKIQAIGIRLSSRSQRVLGLSPNRLDPGVPLNQISKSLYLGKLRFNLSNLSLKPLGKRIRFRCSLSKGKERILLLGLNSLGLSLSSIGRSKLNIFLSLTRRKKLLDTRSESRSERGHNITAGLSKRLRRGGRTGIGTGINTHSLNTRYISKRRHTSFHTCDTLSRRGIVFIPILLILLSLKLRKILSIFLLKSALTPIFSGSILNSAPIHLASRNGGSARATKHGRSTDNCRCYKGRHNKLLFKFLVRSNTEIILMLLTLTLGNSFDNLFDTLELIQRKIRRRINLRGRILVVTIFRVMLNTITRINTSLPVVLQTFTKRLDTMNKAILRTRMNHNRLDHIHTTRKIGIRKTMLFHNQKVLGTLTFDFSR